MNKYVINAWGFSGKCWALTIECENVRQVLEAVEDLGLMTNKEKDIGELIEEEQDGT